jgi:hypothetical protein
MGVLVYIRHALDFLHTPKGSRLWGIMLECIGVPRCTSTFGANALAPLRGDNLKEGEPMVPPKVEAKPVPLFRPTE